MMTWMPARADVFYDMRLKAGHDALVAQRWLEATEALRIACFGLLDTPKSLTPCLAQLALAQNGLGRTADVDTTLGRIVEVETRFSAYDPSALDPDLRTKFEALIAQRIAKTTLLGVPSLARIVDPNAGKRATTTTSTQMTTQTGAAMVPATTAQQPAPASSAPTAPPASQPAAQPATTTAPSSSNGSSATSTPPPAATTRTQTAASPQPPTPDLRAATPARTAADSVDTAKRLLAEGKAGEAKPLLVNAVTRDPGRRELRLLLLQASVLASDWQTAVQQVPPAAPFADNEAAAMFYASIALYENRRESEARELMARALPRLAPSSYVDNYAKRILGR